MGAYNSTISSVTPNLYISPSGQIMRVYLPTNTPSQIKAIMTSNMIAIPANSSQKVQFEIEGCQPGQTVYISPSAELPDGQEIAYARVSDPGKVEVKLTNTTVQEIDQTEMNFIITALN